MEEFFGDGCAMVVVVGYPEVTNAGNGGPRPTVGRGPGQMQVAAATIVCIIIIYLECFDT